MARDFKLPDTFRQNVEKDASRSKEVTDKIVRDGENSLITKFLTLFGNGRLATSTTDLQRGQGETSSSIVFNGKITVNAQVEDADGTKDVSVTLPVKDNKVSLLEDVELQKLVSESDVKDKHEDFTVGMEDATPLEADLSLFRLEDDGSDFLKVYHPALDAGRELGVIGKNEYESLKDKESIFKDIIENQVKGSHIENHYELKFTGSFVEPTVVIKAEEAGNMETVVPSIIEHLEATDPDQLIQVSIDYYINQNPSMSEEEVNAHVENLESTDPDQLTQIAVEYYTNKLESMSPEDVNVYLSDMGINASQKSKVTKKAAQDICDSCKEPIPENMKGVCEYCKNKSEAAQNDLPLGLQEDGFRKHTEFESQKINSNKEKLSNGIITNLIGHLKGLSYEAIKVSSVDDSGLTYGDGFFTGKVDITTSIQNKEGSKIVTIPVSVISDAYQMPKEADVAELFSKGRDPQAEIEKELKTEADDRVAEIEEHDNWAEHETEAALEDIKIEKTASESGGIQYLGPSKVLKIEKHLLNMPDDTEVGAVMFADGFHWKLTSKSEQKLSKGKDDGSIWTFTQVEAEDKEPEHKLSF